MFKVIKDQCSFFISVLILIPLFFVGLYPDEIATQIFGTRFFEDFPYRSSVLPQCFDSFKSKISYFLYLPAIILSPISWIHDTRVFRLFTIATTFVTLILIRRAFLKTYPIDGANFFLIYVLAALSGTKLYTIVLFRPEMFAILFIVYGYCITSQTDTKYSEKVIFLILYLCLVYIHPLGLYFMPAVILVLFKNITLTVFALICSASSYKLWWHQLFTCVEPRALKLTSSFNISPLTIFESPLEFFSNIFVNLEWVIVKKIVTTVLISDDNSYTAAFFPKFDTTHNFLYTVSNIVTSAVFISSFLWGLVFLIKNIYQWRRLGKIEVYCSLILLAIFTHLLLNRTYAFYATNFWYVALSLLFFLNLNLTKIAFAAKYTVIVLAFFSISINYSLLLKIYDHDGPNLSLQSPYYYTKEYRKLVLDKFDQCCSSIENDKFQIDDASYFILKKKIKYPIPITYNSLFGTRDEINKIRGIEYSIAACHRNAALYDGVSGEQVDGGYGIYNICFLKLIN